MPSEEEPTVSPEHGKSQFARFLLSLPQARLLFSPSLARRKDNSMALANVTSIRAIIDWIRAAIHRTGADNVDPPSGMRVEAAIKRSLLGF